VHISNVLVIYFVFKILKDIHYHRSYQKPVGGSGEILEFYLLLENFSGIFMNFVKCKKKLLINHS